MQNPPPRLPCKHATPANTPHPLKGKTITAMKERRSFHSVHFKSVFLIVGVRCCVAPTISGIAGVIFVVADVVVVVAGAIFVLADAFESIAGAEIELSG
jgi:hypothetical protein